MCKQHLFIDCNAVTLSMYIYRHVCYTQRQYYAIFTMSSIYVWHRAVQGSHTYTYEEKEEEERGGGGGGRVGGGGGRGGGGEQTEERQAEEIQTEERQLQQLLKLSLFCLYTHTCIAIRNHSFLEKNNTHTLKRTTLTLVQNITKPCVFMHMEYMYTASMEYTRLCAFICGGALANFVCVCMHVHTHTYKRKC